MTAYTNIPETNRLHEESQRVSTAINLIDDGGTIGSFLVWPKPAEPGVLPTGSLMMPVNISVTEPCSEPLLDELRMWLVEREKQLAEQLQALGVTAQPPART